MHGKADLRFCFGVTPGYEEGGREWWEDTERNSLVASKQWDSWRSFLVSGPLVRSRREMGKWRDTKCSAKRQPAAVEQYELLEFVGWLDHSVAFGVAIGVTQVELGFSFSSVNAFFHPPPPPLTCPITKFLRNKRLFFLFSEVE